jgi:hypothetical protein
MSNSCRACWFIPSFQRRCRSTIFLLGYDHVSAVTEFPQKMHFLDNHIVQIWKSWKELPTSSFVWGVQHEFSPSLMHLSSSSWLFDCVHKSPPKKAGPEKLMSSLGFASWPIQSVI